MAGFGFGFRRRRRKRPASAGVVYDYIIQNPGDWSAPQVSTLKASGGIIGVAPYAGNYSNITFAATPSAPLIVSGVDPNNMPIIDKLELGNLGHVALTQMRCVTSDWNSNPTAAIKMGIGVSGTSIISGAASLNGLKIGGNYRGDINAHSTFDYVTDDFPEYACIWAMPVGGSYPVGSTATGALTIPPYANYVGDLVADGTNIPLTAIAGDAVPGTPASGFAGFMNVSGGRIVYAEITAGGTGYDSTGSPYNKIGWANRRPMANYLPRGIEGKLSVVPGGQFSLLFNEFTLVGSAYKPSFATGTSTDWFRARGNIVDGCYLDVFATTIRTLPALMSYEFNKITRLFCRIGDANDPHPDGFQHLMFPSTGNWVPRVEFIGNEAVAGPNSRGDAGQFIFMSDANGHAYEVHAVGNIGLFLAPNGISADVSSNSFIYGNTSLPGKSTHSAHTSMVSVLLSNGATTQAYGQSLIEDNITEDTRTGAAASSKVTIRNNVKTGLRKLNVLADQAYYDALFGNHSEPNTISDLRAMRTAIGANAGKGAYRDPLWINHAAMTYDRTREPSFIKFPTVINQTPNSTATSAWAKLIGGPDMQPVSVASGSFDTATNVDPAGAATGVTTGLTSATVARGTFIRRVIGTAAGGSQPTTQLMTVRGSQTFAFTAITAVASSYTVADNQGTAYSKITTLPVFTGAQGFLMAMRVRADAYVTNSTLLANSTGTNFNLIWSGNQWRLTMKNSSTIAPRWSMTQAVGQMQTLIIAIDMTKTTNIEGCRMFANGNELGLASGAFPSSGTTTIASSEIWATPNLGVLAKGTSGTNPWDGAIEWMWLKQFSSIGSMPDISDPAILAEFSTDKFISGAGGATGVLPQADLFFGDVGSLSLWDGTFPNTGATAGANLVKQAGNFV